MRFIIRLGLAMLACGALTTAAAQNNTAAPAPAQNAAAPAPTPASNDAVAAPAPANAAAPAPANIAAPAPANAASSAPAAQAASSGTPPPAMPMKEMQWSFEGPFGMYDRAALQRGFQV
jgi:pyruvate dehydrogenase E2 component (dihydrolipoamide acetyltransferase)